MLGHASSWRCATIPLGAVNEKVVLLKQGNSPALCVRDQLTVRG